MEEVLDKLESTLITEKLEPKNFESLYKNWGKLGNQEERRNESLLIQKNNRNKKLDKLRGLLDTDFDYDEEDIFPTQNKARYHPKVNIPGFTKSTQKYRNVLMFSEWLVEKPLDFHNNWLAVSCPKGTRMLVVSNNGRTKCYTKYGQFRFECRTALPGGNPCDRKRNQSCILDCFYHEQNNTMYVLDLLAWNHQPMTDGEAEFRHFWLQNQLSEIPNLKIINKRNQMLFTLLPKVSCAPESFQEFMLKYPPFESDYPARDGILFYHKRAHYISGETPLVGWLYPFMVPEVLGEDIKVNDVYAIEKPEDYTNLQEFIISFEKRKVNKKKNIITSVIMDTTEATDEEDDFQENEELNFKVETMEAEETSVKKDSCQKTTLKDNTCSIDKNVNT